MTLIVSAVMVGGILLVLAARALRRTYGRVRQDARPDGAVGTWRDTALERPTQAPPKPEGLGD